MKVKVWFNYDRFRAARKIQKAKSGGQLRVPSETGIETKQIVQMTER